MSSRDMRWQAQDPWAGAFMHANPFLSLSHYRFRADDGNLTSATWLAPASNVNQEPNPSEYSKPTLVPGQAFRLRLTTEERAGAAITTTVALQYRLNGGAWTTITTSTPLVRMRTSPHVAHGTAVPRLLIQWNNNYTNGVFYDTANGGSFSYPGFTSQESEWSLVLDQSGFTSGDAIEFRTTFGGLAPDMIVQTPMAYMSVPTAPTTAPTLSITNRWETWISLSWGTISGAASYELQRKLASQGDGSYVTVQNTSATTRNDTGLTPNTNYSYRVRAVNSAGNGPWSNVVTNKTITMPVRAQTLWSPSVTYDSVTLQWTHEEDPHRIATRWEILRNGISEWQPNGAAPSPLTFTQMYTGVPWVPGSTHTFRVRGHNDQVGAWSNEIQVTIPDAPALPPPAPTLSLTGVGERSVSLSWTLVGGADWYHLYQDEVLVHGTASDNAAVLDLEPNTTYTFVVRAVNDAGESVDSNAIVVTTDSAGEARSGGSGASVAVSAAGGGSVTGWVLDAIIEVGPSDEYLDADVDPQETYRYFIRAGTALVWGEWWGPSDELEPALPDRDGGAGAGVSVTSGGGGVTLERHESGAGASVTAAPAAGGAPGKRSGADSSVSVATAGGGEAREARSGGAGASVAVSSGGVGAPAHSGGAGTSVAVLAGGGASTGRRAGGEARIAVAAAGGTSTAGNGGAGSKVEVAASGQGVTERASGAGANVSTLVAGGGEPGMQHGSGAVIGVGASGEGEAGHTGGSPARVEVRSVGGAAVEEHRSSGSGALVAVESVGGGLVSEQRAGGAGALVAVSSGAVGAPAYSDGTGASVAVSAGGRAGTSREGGGEARVAVAAAGGSSAAANGGAGSRVEVVAAGEGRTERASGAGASLTALADGGGSPGMLAGSGATVAVSASGAGEAHELRSGGSGATVAVGAAGAGATARSRGADAAVTVAASGAGAVEERRTSGAGAEVSVTAGGAGEAVEHRTGGSGALVMVAVEGAGLAVEYRQGGAGADVAVTAEAGAVTDREQGAHSRIVVSAAGGSEASANSGAGSSVLVSASTGVETDRAGGAGSSAAASASTGVATHRSGGAGSTVGVSTGVATEAGRRAGASADIVVTAAGGGEASADGAAGAGSLIAVLAAGGASTHRSGGAGSALSTSAAATGSPGRQGGQGRYVEVQVDGGGLSSREGGALTRVEVTAEGAGISSVGAVGGSGSQVGVSAGGGGWKAIASGASALIIVTARTTLRLRTLGLFDEPAPRPQRFDQEERPMPFVKDEGRALRFDALLEPDHYAELERVRALLEFVQPARHPMTTRPGHIVHAKRVGHFARTVVAREEVPMELEFVKFGPYTVNEIPEPLYVRVFETLRSGETRELHLYEATPPWQATVSIKEPDGGAIAHRAAVIVNPDDLPTLEPYSFDVAEEGWVRIDWQDGDFSQAGEYEVQLTLDNGTLRLKSTAVYKPAVFDGPAAQVAAV